MNSNEIEINLLVKVAQNSPNQEEKFWAVEKICKKLKPFRFSLAKKFANKGVEFDDIVQQIDLKLLEAIYDYDEKMDPSALRHLTSKARNGIWNYYRKEMNYFNESRRTVSLDEVRKRPMSKTVSPDNEYDLYELIEDIEVFDEDRILSSIIIKEELDKLTPHQKEILFMCFVDDKTQYDIAEELSINQSNVSRAKKRGIQSIKDSISPSDAQSDNS